MQPIGEKPTRFILLVVFLIGARALVCQLWMRNTMSKKWNMVLSWLSGAGDAAKSILAIAAVLAGIEAVSTGWIPDKLGYFFGSGVERAADQSYTDRTVSLIRNSTSLKWIRDAQGSNPKPRTKLGKAQGSARYLICWQGNGGVIIQFNSSNTGKDESFPQGDIGCLELFGKTFEVQLNSGSKHSVYETVFYTLKL